MKTTKLNTTMKTTKLNSALIESFKDRIASASKLSAECEQALAEAQKEKQQAVVDDGKIFPEILYDRGEAARKKVFLRKTEAKRGAENLAEIEAEFLELIKSNYGNVTSALGAHITTISDAIRERLSPLIAKGDGRAERALGEFILQCDDVRIPNWILSRLYFIAGVQEWHGMRNEFEEAIRIIEAGKPSELHTARISPEKMS